MPKANIDTEIAVMKNEINHIKEKIDSHDLLLINMDKNIAKIIANQDKKIENTTKEFKREFAGKWTERAVYSLGAGSFAMIVAIVLFKLGLL